jgi:hypothetical protein
MKVERTNLLPQHPKPFFVDPEPLSSLSADELMNDPLKQSRKFLIETVNGDDDAVAGGRRDVAVKAGERGVVNGFGEVIFEEWDEELGRDGIQGGGVEDRAASDEEDWERLKL